MAFYYVATDGDDSNSGSVFDPWASWQKAFNSTTVQPGDTVYFRGGVYIKDTSIGSSSWYYPDRASGGINITRSGTSENWINYWAYPGEVPILDCTTSYTTSNLLNYGIRTSGAFSYVHFKGLVIQNVKQYETTTLDTSNSYAISQGWYKMASCQLWHGTGSPIIMENMIFRGCDGKGLECGGATAPDYNYYINCDFHDCCDTQTHWNPDSYDGPGNDGEGVFLTGGGQSKFIGCRFWDTGDQGIAIGILSGTNVTCTFDATGGAMENIINKTSHGLSNGTKVVFGGTGILPTGLSRANLLFYYVIDSNTDYFRVSLTEGGSVVNLNTDGSGTLNYSVVTSAYDQYVELDSCWSFYNGRMTGIGHGAALGWFAYTDFQLKRTIKNCIFTANKKDGIFSLDYKYPIAGYWNLYNNTIILNGWRGREDYEWGDGLGQGAGIQMNNTLDTDAHEYLRVVKNNIVYGNEYGPIYLGTGALYTHAFNSYDMSLSLTDDDFVDLDWIQLLRSRKSDGSLPDITFGKLRTGSDCIHAGTDVSLSTDGAGRSWDNPNPSIGAFEYWEGDNYAKIGRPGIHQYGILS